MGFAICNPLSPDSLGVVGDVGGRSGAGAAWFGPGSGRHSLKLTVLSYFAGNFERSSLVSVCQKRSLAFWARRSAESVDDCETRNLVTRLYQWLRERTRVLRVTSRDEETRKTVRTEVTVQEKESALLFAGGSWSGPKNCPLCGNPMFPVPSTPTDEKAQELKLGHRDGQGTCPGPEDGDKTKGPQQGEGPQGNDQRRLR